MEKIIRFRPAFDNGPDQGIADMTLCFILKGEHGAVDFAMGTGMYLKKNRDQLFLDGIVEDLIQRAKMMVPQGRGINYHSPVPRFEGQRAVGSIRFDWENKEQIGTKEHPLEAPTLIYTDEFTPCEFTGGKCYMDGNITFSRELMEEFLEHGEEVVWKHLEEYYVDTFGELK